jgi:hypothetical protein
MPESMSMKTIEEVKEFINKMNNTIKIKLDWTEEECNAFNEGISYLAEQILDFIDSEEK